jgi:DNA-binding NarL/FixJ family response regulator
MIRILIADDHEMIRRGLRDLLEKHPGWEVCGEAANGRQAVELATKLSPEVVLLDLSMPEMNGLEATYQIKKALPNTEILVFTMHETEDFVRDALGAGALGYLLKSDAAMHITAAVEALCAHKPFFTGTVSRAMLEIYLARYRESLGDEASVAQLTAREREVVQLLAEGRSNKAVSALLGISTKTAETHRAAVMRKLGVKSLAELIRYAVRNRIIEP